jgi:hypothetical protein
VLIAKLAVLNAVDQTALVLQVMPQLFDSRLMTLGGLGEIDVPTLQMLVAIAYRTVRVEDDNDRSTGEVYSPELRDKAQDARAIAFNLLVRTPGRASFDALHALKTMPEFSARAAHLEALARERAAQDSEVSVWVEDAAMLYERRWEKEPATGRELQMLAIQRIEDIQHDLLHADFAQGPTLSALPDEAAVQSWLADRMRLTQGWSYSVEREPETVAAKKPDIVLTARAANAKLPTEIKVAETWSLRELEVALEGQLCGQYLRARNCREGLLVLVHQKPRSMGWAAPDGTYLSFAQLVDRLKDQAQRIGQSSPSGPQPAIAVIDVTTCVRTAAVKSVRRKRSGKSPDAAGGAKQSRAATKRAARDTRTGSGRTAGAAARSDDSTQPGQPSPPGAARKP